MMYERPLHLKHSLERITLAQQPTERHTAVRLPKVTIKLPVTEMMLPLDRFGRSYLVSFRRSHIYGTLWDDTICQVSELADRYYELSKGRYPAEILLSPQRYFMRRCERFYPMSHSAKPIRFNHEDCDTPYEILVRGVV